LHLAITDRPASRAGTTRAKSLNLVALLIDREHLGSLPHRGPRDRVRRPEARLGLWDGATQRTRRVPTGRESAQSHVWTCRGMWRAQRTDDVPVGSRWWPKRAFFAALPACARP